MRLYLADYVKDIAIAIALSLVISVAPATVVAFDLIPDAFKATKINRYVWQLQEQYVALAPPVDQEMARRVPNQHPVALDLDEVRDALLSLGLWVDGGFFRDEEAEHVFSPGQVATMVRYVVDALSQANRSEDVVFNIGGYGTVAADLVSEKYWTAGRIFYANRKLNIIIGTHQAKKDRGTRQAEGAYGILNNYADIRFDHGNRGEVANMPGRISTTIGVTLSASRGRERPDWVQVDIAAAAFAFQDSLLPEEEKRREVKVKQEAAKLTVERRQMREEMARLRKQLDNLKSGGLTAAGLEQRLATLQELKDRDLITDDEFQDRRQAILEEL